MNLFNSLPERTTLIPIEPIDIDSWKRESLTSYFRRLCAENGLRVSRVFIALVLPHLSGTSVSMKKKGFPAYDYRWVNGNGKSGNEWVDILETLTGNSGLRRLTLLNWGEIATRSLVLIERHRKWCPACYQQAADQRTPVYDQLAWTIRGFDCCPEHDVLLEKTCPHCHKGPFHQLTGNDVAGFCPHCQKWLGSEATTSLNRDGSADSYTAWTARSIASLLTCHGLIRDVADRTHFITINKLIDKYFSGSQIELAKLLGRSKGVVFGWRHGKWLPSWEAWCQLSYCFAIPMQNLLTGDIDNLKPSSPRELPQVRTATRRKPKQRNWLNIRRFLREAAKKDPPHFNSMEAVAKHLGLHARQLSQNLPKEYAVLSKRLATHRKHEHKLARKRKDIALTSDIQGAISLLQQHDQPLTRRNTERALSIRKVKITRNNAHLLAQCLRSAQNKSYTPSRKKHAA